MDREHINELLIVALHHPDEATRERAGLEAVLQCVKTKSGAFSGLLHHDSPAVREAALEGMQEMAPQHIKEATDTGNIRALISASRDDAEALPGNLRLQAKESIEQAGINLVRILFEKGDLHGLAALSSSESQEIPETVKFAASTSLINAAESTAKRLVQEYRRPSGKLELTQLYDLCRDANLPEAARERIGITTIEAMVADGDFPNSTCLASLRVRRNQTPNWPKNGNSGSS